MSLSKTAVNRPTTTLIIFAILVALGLYAASDLPLDLLPDEATFADLIGFIQAPATIADAMRKLNGRS